MQAEAHSRCRLFSNRSRGSRSIMDCLSRSGSRVKGQASPRHRRGRGPRPRGALRANNAETATQAIISEQGEDGTQHDQPRDCAGDRRPPGRRRSPTRRRRPRRAAPRLYRRLQTADFGRDRGGHPVRCHRRHSLRREGLYSSTLTTRRRGGGSVRWRRPSPSGAGRNARAFCQHFFAGHNHRHHHSGLGLLAPAAVHLRPSARLFAQGQSVLDAAYRAHPERFVRRPPDLPRSGPSAPKPTRSPLKLSCQVSHFH